MTISISKRHYFAVMAAFLFLLALPPAEARAAGEDDTMCFACGDCHPDLWCMGCGVYTLYAISGCCGMGSGDAYCLNEWGGFAVNCHSGAYACQCNKTGENCYML